MNFLAIDTVFDKCGVAILVNGENKYFAEKLGKRQQTQQILPMIDEALSTLALTLADFDALIFNRGPGAFSGIRINTAVVQALSFAHDIPCVGISSLQVLAQSGYEMAQDSDEQNDMIHGYAVLDARMKQVYIGEYQLIDGMMNLVEEELLLDYSKMTSLDLPLLHLASDDKNLLSLHEKQVVVDNLEPNAKTLAKIGAYQFSNRGGLSAEQALPVYLRNNAWKTLKEQGKS